MLARSARSRCVMPRDWRRLRKRSAKYRTISGCLIGRFAMQHPTFMFGKVGRRAKSTKIVLTSIKIEYAKRVHRSYLTPDRPRQADRFATLGALPIAKPIP